MENTDDKQKLNDEYKETLQRLQAEFENYKKRAAKENAEQVDLGKRLLIQRLLPVLDSFELSLQHAPKSPENKLFVQGIELVFAQFISVLEAEGLRSIKAVGEKLDPYRHEVLLQEHSDKEGIVLEEFQKGYTLRDAIIRCSKVKLGKKCDGNKQDNTKGNSD